MRVQLISHDNGFGMTKDVAVMRSVLEPLVHDVHFTQWDKPRNLPKYSYDLNVFLEVINPSVFGQAARNWLIGNPEWTLPSWIRHLRTFDLILAKTRDAERIYSRYGTAKYVGFTSPDIYTPTPKRNVVLHLAGKSTAKGTSQVMEAARMLPEIEFVFGKGTTEEVRRLQNECWIHCQPSTYEGFGHVINEAKACASVVVTTAAEPMTDLVCPMFGYGASYCRETTDKNMPEVTHKIVCVDSLVESIRSAFNRTDKEQLGSLARASYLKDRTEFVQNITALL